ncbi:MAG: NAD(+) synthase [Synergistaceae bacterium]|nr:NAD(+) synthase [Synergistaceae bacterium]MBQ3345538.1 NAD(+) synthase [Synergistaceae bacterium]MBQ6113825.1 NAD(+) synthase [Synergistaceae bacterium]MBQ6418461.1 NAD(+) synthase [Synergistaceae bacterium]MBQ6663989.1 NAD(+) synthase [Synergistaceae bacterium]
MRDIVIKCEQWLSDEVKKAGASGIILGLSGGIDSSVLAALGREALGHDGVLGVIMPCHSNPNDEADAKLLAETLDVKYTRVDLSAAYDSMCASLGVEVSPLVSSNMKARLRMVTLYALGQSNRLLVCGTSNRSEYETGYFTKYGDSGSDLMPLASFLKRDIRAMAKILGVPERIITKAPSAGLVDGQTDEGDMGFTYDVLDEYLASGKIDDLSAKERIDVMRRRSEHKRKPIPIFRP